MWMFRLLKRVFLGGCGDVYKFAIYTCGTALGSIAKLLKVIRAVDQLQVCILYNNKGFVTIVAVNKTKNWSDE
jgi:hypothetical protein